MADLADRLGRSAASVQQKARDMGLYWGKPAVPETEQPPSANRDLSQIFADKAVEFERKKAHHESKSKGLEIKLPGAGPYGILFFGDPHLDDPAADLARISWCLQLVKETPELYAANLGDLTNNWVGPLARLNAHQNTTDDEGQELIRWILQAASWLFVILGNHDKWTDTAELLCKQYKVPYVSHGAKFRVQREGHEMVLDARHDHPGRSMYNPSHAQLRKTFRGSNADIVIAGHTHQGAYTQIKNGETGKIGHCVRVGSFKSVDEYADRLGLMDGCISPAVLCVVNPKAEPESMVTVFQDPKAGAQYLGFLRSKA